MNTQITETNTNQRQQPSQTSSAEENFPFFSTSTRKSRGKIATLPADKRDLINSLLDNGATYGTVVAELSKHGVSLNLQNLSNWYHSGFQDYLRRQDWLTQLTHLQEEAADLPDPSDPSLHQAVLHVGVLKIFQSLKSGLSTADPVNEVRQLNALARLSRLSAQVKKQANAEANPK